MPKKSGSLCRHYWRMITVNYNDEWLGNFRFKQNDLYNIVQTLGLPYDLICPNGKKASGIEALGPGIEELHSQISFNDVDGSMVLFAILRSI